MDTTCLLRSFSEYQVLHGYFLSGNLPIPRPEHRIMDHTSQSSDSDKRDGYVWA
jgi:hypothetical protein